MKRILIIFICTQGAFGALFLNAQFKVPKTYHGVKITPHTLYGLMPSIPHALKIKIDEWLYQLGGQEVVRRLALLGNPAVWQQKWEDDTSMLAQHSYKNYSSDGYVLKMPNGHLIKIAGPKHRLLSMLATKGVTDHALLSDEDQFNELVREHLAGDIFATYQTASRAAHYLLAAEFLKKRAFDYIAIPHTYVRYVPGNKKDVSDENIMLIQEYVSGQTQLVNKPELISLLPNRAIAELYDVIVATGMWNIKSDILVNKTGQLVLKNGLHVVGFEGYPNTSSKDFFHRNKERFHKNQILGVKSLMELFASDQAKINYIKSLVQDDARLCRCARKCGILGFIFNRTCGCACEGVQELLDFEP